MAIFGKGDPLSAILKKIKATDRFDSAELKQMLDALGADPQFKAWEQLWLLRHKDENIRSFARNSLATLREPRVAQVIIGAMVTQPPDIQREHALLAIQMAPEQVNGWLGRMVVSRDVNERDAALALIDGHRSVKHLLGYLKTALKDPTPQIRQRAVKMLGREVDDQAIFFILRGLISDDDPVVREMVIKALARHPVPDMIEPFFERLTQEPPEIRTLIMRALKTVAQTSQTEVEKHLLPILADEDPVQRDTAVQLLAGLPDKTRVLRSFLLHCRGLASWLRERSIDSITKISNDIVEPLITLMDDSDPDVRINAMMMAATARDPRIVPVVQAIFLGEEDWWIRSMAADVLGNFSDPAVTEVLLSRMSDPDLRYSVVSVLSKQQNEQALEMLWRCLRDKQRGIRKVALESLRAYKDADTMERIALVAKHDPEQSVRDKALSVLVDFGAMSHKIRQDLAKDELQEIEKPATQMPVALEMVNESLNPM